MILSIPQEQDEGVSESEEEVLDDSSSSETEELQTEIITFHEY